jgi:hypothetical protein
MDHSTSYQIRVEGHLEDTWANWFESLSMNNLHDGTVLLSGSVPDQAALHGILNRIFSLGLKLISVNRVLAED